MQLEPDKRRRARHDSAWHRQGLRPQFRDPAERRGRTRGRPSRERRASSTSGAPPSRPGTARRSSPTSRTSRERASAARWPPGRTRARRRSGAASRSSGRRARSSCAGRTPSTLSDRRGSPHGRSRGHRGDRKRARRRNAAHAGCRPFGRALRRGADRRRDEGRLHPDASEDLPRHVSSAPPCAGRAREARAGRDLDPAAHRPGRRAAGTTPAEFEIVPGALRVRVPAQVPVPA